MKIKYILVVLFLIGIVAASCKNDDDDEVISIPPRLLADQTVDDDVAIQAYLETHFYNYEEFENPPEDFDFKIEIDTIAGVNADRIPLLSQISSETASANSPGLLNEINLSSTPNLFAKALAMSGETPWGLPSPSWPVTNKKLLKFIAALRYPLGASCFNTKLDNLILFNKLVYILWYSFIQF